MKKTNMEMLEHAFRTAKVVLVNNKVSTDFLLYLNDNKYMYVTAHSERHTYEFTPEQVNEGKLIEGGVIIDFYGQPTSIVPLGIIANVNQVTSNVADFDDSDNTIETTVLIGDVDGQLLVKAEGYGNYHQENGEGYPIVIENAYGNLQLRVFADINQEEPTHVISLDKAKTTRRTN